MASGDALHYSRPFLNSDGTPYAGVKCYTYSAGTTSNKTTWVDAGKTTTATNPVIGDSRGYVSFYGDGDYRLIVTDSSGNVLYDWDHVRITSDEGSLWEGNYGTALPVPSTKNRWQQFSLIDANNNMLGHYQSTGTQFAPITNGYSVRLFGAKGDGITNDSTAISAAATAANSAGVSLIFPKGTYLSTGTHTFSGFVYMEYGAIISDGTGCTLTFNGGYDGTLSQHFFGFAAGDVTGLKVAKPKWFGSTNVTGSTADSDALNKALAAAPVVDLCGINHFLNSLVVMPANTKLTNTYYLPSGLTCENSTGAIRMGNYCTIDNVGITATAGYTGGFGLGIGDNAVQVTGCHVIQSRVSGFSGTNGIGIKLGQVTSCILNAVDSQSNYYGWKIPAGLNAPTDTTLIDCQARDNTDVGFYAESGYEFDFLNCNFESNGKEAVRILSTSTEIYNWEFHGCRFESNYNSLSGASREAQASVNMDAVSNMRNMAFVRCVFDYASGGGFPCAIDAGDVKGLKIDHPIISNVVRVRGATTGYVVNFAPEVNPTTAFEFSDTAHLHGVVRTWTPAISFDNPGNLAITYTTQNGSYITDGKDVRLTYYILTSTFTHTTASGNLRITGLPFTAVNIANRSYVGASSFGGITKTNYSQFTPRIDSNTNYIIVRASGSGQSIAYVTAADMPTSGTVEFIGEIIYGQIDLK